MQETGQSEAEPEIQPTTPQFNKPVPYLGPRTPQDTAVAFCALGILLCFFAPWIQSAFGSSPLTGALYYKSDPSAAILWAVPILAAITIAVHRNSADRQKFGTATSIVAAFSLFYFVGIAAFKSGGSMAWGASLTVWFGLGLYAFCGERRITAPGDFVAKKLGSRKAEVFSHWGTLTPGCHFSTQDFYLEIEQAIRAKQWPGVEMLRLDFHESGLLSHKREYLRVIRQRQLFDVCASTFGKDYFFTVREAQIPVVIDLRAMFSAVIGLFLLFSFAVKLLGLILGSMAILFLITFAVWFLFNVLKLGLTKMDSMLMQLPVIGAFYEAWFRRDTYFQQDSRLIFLQCVNELVKEHVEETTSTKGIKYLNCFENQPLLDGLYRRSRIQLDETEATPAIT